MSPSPSPSTTSHSGALPPDPPGTQSRSLATLPPGTLPPDPPWNLTPSDPSGNSLAVSFTAAGLIAASIAGAVGCSGSDSCGPGGVPGIGLIADNPVVILTYGQLTASLNNDCPTSDAPAGVISMTVGGTQLDGQGRITLCVG